MVGDSRSTDVMDVFSTITSPVFSELVIVTTEGYHLYLPRDLLMFETLRAMNEIIPFKLVFLLETSEQFLRKAQQELAGALEFMTAKGLLDFLDSPPTTRIALPRDFLHFD